MFKNLIRPDGPLMITMNWITDSIFLSLFWLLGCFPVVTAGAAFAALYDASYRGFRRGEKNVWQRFARVFRVNWKTAIVPTLITGGIVAVLVRTLIRVWNAAATGSISMMVFSGAAFLAVLLLGSLSIVFPMLSRFDNPVGLLLKNSLLLSIAHLPRTVALGIINAATVLLCVRFVIPLFFLPAPAALLGSLLIEPMFKPYMPEEEAAE